MVLISWRAPEGAKASGNYKIASADLEFKNGSAWKRVTKFQNVYFAFRTAKMGGGAERGAELCKTAWHEVIPTSLDGQYFVGRSRPTPNDQAAFQDAMLDARRQVVQYIGSMVRETRTQHSQNLDAVLTDDATVSTAAQGLVQLVKDRCQKSEPVDGPTVRYKVQALTFLPNAEIGKAAAALAKSLEQAGKLSSADANALRDSGDHLKPAGGR